MKSVVILYESKSEYAQEKVFGGKNAFEKTYEWAEKFCEGDIVKIGDCINVAVLLKKMAETALEKKADYIIFTYDDLPFINTEITRQLVEHHLKYHAEYTFQDGYPSGFAPEIINSQACAIMAKLAESNLKEAGEKPLSRTCIYDFLKNDINSFEVETIIAPKDWRLYRFAFNTGCKRDFLSCKGLQECADLEKVDVNNADSLAELAARSVKVLKTLPAFYSIEICEKVSSYAIYNPLSLKKSAQEIMSFDKFAKITDKISDFSEDAVISLSVCGEPLLNPDCLKMAEYVLSKPELSLFLETDGINITEDFCKKIKDCLSDAPKSQKNPYPKLMIAVQLDAFTKEGYAKIRNNSSSEDFDAALKSVSLISSILPACVYPQFIRMNENEEELESFFRFWNEKTSPAAGNFIIQKYDSMAALLPDRKPADLSPLERILCWHLRRDMTILANGDVTICRACMFEKSTGNVFSEDLEAVWHKNDSLLRDYIENNLNERCGKCDEFYTFNF